MPGDSHKQQDPNATIVDSDKTVVDEATLVESDQTIAEGDARGAVAPEESNAPPKHPGRIGHFTIIDTLGEGGMGAVYLAEQKEPVERRVALKLVHASLRSPEALARFNAERQAMARLSHPNIAALFEAGATDDGFPFFAMENVPGATLTAYCDEQDLSVRQRLELFVQICEGVQHAHQKGIIHRDLKPSNLLIATIEGKPVPKVIDFGIAKALDEPLHAASELTGLQAIGTPAFMSPEALAGSQDLDTRTDVFSLGVILYELLAGVRPHQKLAAAVTSFKADAERTPARRPSIRVGSMDKTTAAAIASRRGISPAELTRRIGGDLDWIAMKAIADEPDRRYATAAELAADIGRHLGSEPVLARSPTAQYLAGRFVKRHRLAVSAAALIVIALVLGIFGTTLGLLRAQKAETEAVAQAGRADREAAAVKEVADFMTGLFEVSDPGEARGNTITARELLDRGAGRIGTELDSQPLLQARLMDTMGDVYGKLGLYNEAVALEEKTLHLREAELGPDDPEVASSLNALGDLYRQQARYKASEDAIKRGLDIREAAFGQDHPNYAESLNSLAAVKFWFGQKDEAERLYRQAIAIRESSADVDPADLANSLHHLGWLLGNQGHYVEAETALQRALDIRENVLGENHFEVADTLIVLASVYTYQARYNEAGELMLRALKIDQLVLEPDHPDIGESLLALGTLHRFQGQLIESEDYLSRAAVLFEASQGEDHVNLARVLGELGWTLGLLERWGEAEAAYYRQLGIYEKKLDPNHLLVGETLNNLGWVLSDGLQHYDQGEKVLRRSVAVFKTGADPDNYWNALSRWSLANNLRDQGRYADAGPYFEQAYDILKRIGGANRVVNPDLDQLVADYAKSLRAAGKDAEAVALEIRLKD